MPHSVKWSANSVAGTKKRGNEDAWIIFTAGKSNSIEQKAEGTHSLEFEDAILAVSDGMGGSNAGDVASKMLLDELSKIVPKTIFMAANDFHPDYLNTLEEAILSISQSINQKAIDNPELKGMGATLTLAWLTPDRMYIAHAGDSRLYLHREDKTELITIDHNFVWSKFNRGEISEFQYRTHPKRSVIHEVIGGGHRKVKPYILEFLYKKGDRFMLCSDGIVDGLSEKKIHQKFIQNQSSTNDALGSLIDAAVENDGSDDTTCIIFDII